MVGLKSLSLSPCKRLSTLPSLTRLQCLCELDIFDLGITEIPNLSGLEQLEFINASNNMQLTSLQGLGDLRALTAIELWGCESLCRLPEMSKLSNLKVLDLRFTRVELHEEDIHMLKGLPTLEPILVVGPSYFKYRNSYWLDFKRDTIMCRLSGGFWSYKGWQT